MGISRTKIAAWGLPRAIMSLSLLTALVFSLGSPAAAQSREFMMNECSSAGQTYFRDFTARTAGDMSAIRTSSRSV